MRNFLIPIFLLISTALPASAEFVPKEVYGPYCSQVSALETKKNRICKVTEFRPKSWRGRTFQIKVGGILMHVRFEKFDISDSGDGVMFINGIEHPIHWFKASKPINGYKVAAFYRTNPTAKLESWFFPIPTKPAAWLSTP